MAVPYIRTQTAIGNSAPVCFDTYENPFNVSVQVAIVGTSASCSVQVTADDPQDFASESAYQSDANWYDHATLATITTNSTGTITSPVKAARVVVSAISAATVITTFIQAG